MVTFFQQRLGRKAKHIIWADTSALSTFPSDDFTHVLVVSFIICYATHQRLGTELAMTMMTMFKNQQPHSIPDRTFNCLFLNIQYNYVSNIYIFVCVCIWIYNLGVVKINAYTCCGHSVTNKISLSLLIKTQSNTNSHTHTDEHTKQWFICVVTKKHVRSHTSTPNCVIECDVRQLFVCMCVCVCGCVN